ncbi:MAG TPA: hypothetical protein VKZ18_09615 [Polyangia bacterium]|nr:hypothetical protein [Polyangia bacterium]
MRRPRRLSSAGAAVGLVAAALCGAARADAPADDHRFFLRLSPGVAYLHESWTPSGGAPGAVFSGAGPSLELSIGKSVRPRLVVGLVWQLFAVSEPDESFLGQTYAYPDTYRVLDALAAFADYYPTPRRGLRVGASVGAVAASNLDRQCCLSTSWGPVVSVRVGYDIFFARRWSAGVVAQLEAYRYSSTESNISSTSNGLLPTLAFALTFDWARKRSSPAASY